MSGQWKLSWEAASGGSGGGRSTWSSSSARIAGGVESGQVRHPVIATGASGKTYDGTWQSWGSSSTRSSSSSGSGGSSRSRLCHFGNKGDK